MVITTADKNLDSAKDNIKEAIKNLSTIVIDECWGFDEFDPGYRNILNKAMQQLINIKKIL